MSNSWKKYGGQSKMDKFQHLTIGTLVADQVLLREKVTTQLTFTDTVNIINNGSLNVLQGNITGQNINSTNNLTVEKDATVKGKLNIGSVNNYIYSSPIGIGINNDNPSATLDIFGNLIVRSGTTTLRNVIAQNSNNKGVVVNVNDTYSSLEFYNINSISTNIPNSKITTFDNTYQLDTINQIMNATSTKINSLSSIDISTNNIGNIKAGSILNVSSNGNVNINAIDLLNLVSPSSTIISRLHITTTQDASANILDETVIIYDISNGNYLYDVYEDNTKNTGCALTLAAKDNTSTTFMNIITPSKLGLAMGGGAYVKDSTRSFATIGINNNGLFVPSQNIVSGTSKAKYYTTTGFNKYAPSTEKYVVDINGSMRITNGEINKVQDVSFQILNISFSKINKLVGIAVGTPSAFSVPFTQNIYYTNDGGINWNLKTVDNTSTGLASNSKNFCISVFDNNIAFIGANNSNLLITTNGGANWTSISITNSINIQKIFVNEISGTKRIFIGYNTSTSSVLPTTVDYIGYLDYNSNTINSVISTINNTINYVDGYGNYVFFVGNGIQRYNFNTKTIDITTNIGSYTYNSINVYNSNIAIAVGNNVISYTKNGGSNWTTISSFTNTIFNSVYIYDAMFAMVVGEGGKILYTMDGYVTWNIIANDLLNSGGNAGVLNNPNNKLQSVYMPDINSFVISKIIQSYSGSQLGISKIYYCYFPNVFNRSQNTVLDVSGCVQIGGDLNITEGGNLYVKYDSVLSGNLVVSYDVSLNSRLYVKSDATFNKKLFTIGDASFGGNMFVIYDTSLNSRLYVNSDATINKRLYTKGDASFGGNMFVIYDTSLNSRLYVNSDTNINKRLYTKGDASFGGNVFIIYDTSLNSRLYVNSDATINKRLFTNGDTTLYGSLYVAKDTTVIGNLNVTNRIINNSDVFMRSSLFVDYDASINGSVSIGKDLLVNGNLSVKQYQTQNIINTTVSNYNLIISEDISLNGRLFTSNDVSLNGNLYIAKNMNINTTNNITNALVNINGNMITNYVGINTSSVNTNRALDINGNVVQSNGCIFQF